MNKFLEEKMTKDAASIFSDRVDRDEVGFNHAVSLLWPAVEALKLCQKRFPSIPSIDDALKSIGEWEE